MLKKLIKHEWRSVYRVGVLLLIIMAGVTLLGYLAFRSPMWMALAGENNYSGTLLFNPLDILSIFTIMVYVLMLAGLSFAILVYLCVHFYRSMYKDEGYLTHTLPVTGHQLIISKVLVSGIWMLIISLGIYLSLLIIGVSYASELLEDEMSLTALILEIVKIIPELLEGMGIDSVLYVGYLICTGILGPFVSLLTLFGAISMGQLFRKHRVLMAIVCYCGILLINGLIKSMIQSLFFGSGAANEYYESVGGYFDFTMIADSAVKLVTAAIMYLVMHLVVTKKLNLE